MSESDPGRPRQVTLAAWLIMVGSAIVVAMVFDQVAGLHSLETRESVDKFLSEPPGSDLGVTADNVLTLLRTFAMVAAGCATAAAILGYQVLRRSRGARLALTVLAVPLFLTGMVTGGFVSSVVAASAAMLWLQPARDWFDGISRPTAAARVAPVGDPVGDPGQAPGGTASVRPAQHATGAPPRPAAVRWACVLTWVFSGLAVVGLGAVAVALALEPDVLLEQAREQNPDLAAQGVSDAMLLGVTYAILAGLVLWCLAAIAVAVLVYRRVEWARILLIISASAAAALSLASSVLGAVLLVFPLMAAAVTVALLVRSDVRPWFARRDTP